MRSRRECAPVPGHRPYVAGPRVTAVAYRQAPAVRATKLEEAWHFGVFQDVQMARIRLAFGMPKWARLHAVGTGFVHFHGATDRCVGVLLRVRE